MFGKSDVNSETRKGEITFFCLRIRISTHFSHSDKPISTHCIKVFVYDLYNLVLINILLWAHQFSRSCNCVSKNEHLVLVLSFRRFFEFIYSKLSDPCIQKIAAASEVSTYPPINQMFQTEFLNHFFGEFAVETFSSVRLFKGITYNCLYITNFYRLKKAWPCQFANGIFFSGHLSMDILVITLEAQNLMKVDCYYFLCKWYNCIVMVRYFLDQK